MRRRQIGADITRKNRRVTLRDHAQDEADLLVEQNLHFARLISDRAYIIERGRICFGGTMNELDARPDIRDAHLSL